MWLKSSVATNHPRTRASPVIRSPFSQRLWVVLIISVLASLVGGSVNRCTRRSKGLQRTHTSNKAGNQSELLATNQCQRSGRQCPVANSSDHPMRTPGEG